MDHPALTGMMEILLVEDNLEDARLTMEALKQEDVRCRVHLVCDGDEAWDFLHAKGVFARAPLAGFDPARHGIAQAKRAPACFRTFRPTRGCKTRPLSS